jgi:stage II sporulation protein D
VRRSAFLASASATLAALAPGAVHATGGLDVGEARTPHEMRVLLASGTFEPIVPIDDWHFTWNGATYRGTAANVTLTDGRAGLVNALPLDAYLYGVVSRELSASWPRGAQESQAIVARTYALGRLRPAQAYDVVASESDQRYGGIAAETVEGRAAVDATAGTIVTYLGAAARVAYGSCCGGHSADAADVWGSGLPYLRGVADPNCAGTPEYRWQLDLPGATLGSALGARFLAIGDVQTVALRDPDGSGRPAGLVFSGSAGSFDIATRAFRETLGTSVVRSTLLLAVLPRAGGLLVDGGGRGHGVGLCQWGSRMLGAAGWSAGDIVRFYFPGTALGRA